MNAAQPRGAATRLLLSGLLLLALGTASLNLADQYAGRWASQSLERALVTFAAARALNGAISVAQSTEVALQPAGVGVAFEPGQILDPVNDLVERFSWVMLTASASLGIQLLMVEFSQWWLASALLGASIALALLTLWLPGLHTWRAAALRTAATAIVLRFAVTLVALASNAAGEFLLADRETERLQTVELASDQIETLGNNSTPAATDPSWWASAREQLDIVGTARQRLEVLRANVETATRAVIDVIAMYTLQTILLPLLFTWLVLALLRRIWR